MTWSESVNGFLYEYVALVLQASQAYNVTIPGCRKYNVPSGKITIDETAVTPTPNRTTYSEAAITGADDLNDANVTIRDVFDIFVENTREISPTCGSPAIRPTLFVLLTCAQSSRNCLAIGVRAISILKDYVLTVTSPGTTRLGGPSVLLSGFHHTVLSSSSTRFLSSETPSVHPIL